MNHEEFKEFMQRKQDPTGFWKKKREAREEIKRKLDQGEDLKISIAWKTDKNEINLNDQPENFDEVIDGNYSIIEDVDIEKLLNISYAANSALFRERVLLNNDLDEDKILQVLVHWSNGESLIPPHFRIINENELMQSDGKHRINVAYFYRAKSIPIIVANSEFDEITKRLEQQSH